MVRARLDIADAELRALAEMLKPTYAGRRPDPAEYVARVVELANLHELACLMPLMALLAEPRLPAARACRGNARRNQRQIVPHEPASGGD
jgi:hypothetical protein